VEFVVVKRRIANPSKLGEKIKEVKTKEDWL
jgi:hypothetical protein